MLGAFIADSFAGRFWTITVASIIYQILRPPPCQNGQVCQEADNGQLAILYISLLLTAIGSGGIRPCVVAFVPEQFDETDEKLIFAWGVSMLVAVTVIVYIQEYIGRGWGLGVPSIVAFVFGYPLYRNMDPSGSPFTRLVQVCVAAYKKRNLPRVFGC
ncbi:putative proton-dependent oligopeptide transporter family, MFS transporter superfamily [Helianthus annuus]|nr:putative proton-dependent oligopeptide transporter family, MFS transporter superfamily [Helianthus annuus]KAJ0813726.1 putative proton-dependent oligopeptide transporter family, MFS transporter superfamily [Helianthus annuus]